MTNAAPPASEPRPLVRLEPEIADAGVRLDRFLVARLAGLSRSRIQALIRSGCVRGVVAGKLVDPGGKVKPGEAIEVELPEPEPATPGAEPIPLAIVYEDAHLIVLDKPAGIVVHPSPGHATGTLVNALIDHCGASLSGIGGIKRPGIVHRLDKDTSGLLVVAKSDVAHRGLSRQFAAHGADDRLTRGYLALVWGAPRRHRGRIELALARSASNRTRIAVATGQGGRRAVTHFEVLRRFDGADRKPMAGLLECRLETGRTHQIRVHLAHIGHPVIGDKVYGAHFAASARRLGAEAQSALNALGRQALHAAHLGFEHPATGQRLSFDSPLPIEIARLVTALACEAESGHQRPSGGAGGS